MKLKIGHINLKTVVAFVCLPTVLVVAYYAIIATQINMFTLTFDNPTIKNRFIDDFYIPNRHSIEYNDTKIVTKSLIAYFKVVHFLTKQGIPYTVKRITEGAYKNIEI